MAAPEVAPAVPAAPLSLTALQMSCLQVIVEYIDEHGVAPSFNDIRRELDLRTNSQVHRLLVAIEERGWIVRSRYKVRCLRVVHRPPMPDFGDLDVTVAPGEPPARLAAELVAAARRYRGETTPCA